jgi:hygromycin-B 4-O-kinase
MPVTDAAARRFMAERYGSRVTHVYALGAGEWSRAYAMTLDGRPVVIRFGEHVADFRKDQVMAAHSCAALPIPAVSDVGAADDGYFAVSQRAVGQPLDGLDEFEVRALLPGLLAALDAIRQIDIPGSRGYGIWAPDGTGPAASWRHALLAINQETTRVPGWRAALQRFPASVRCFDRAYARLQELVAGLPAERHVIHGDLLNRNVLARGARITAVIDWGNALYGDWLYDAAWLIYWWPWFPHWRGVDISGQLRRHWAQDGLPPGLDHRLHVYQLHIGLDAITYNAFRGRRDDLARNTAQVAELIKE